MRHAEQQRIARRNLRQLMRIAIKAGEDDQEICGVIVDGDYLLWLVRVRNLRDGVGIRLIKAVRAGT